MKTTLSEFSNTLGTASIDDRHNQKALNNPCQDFEGFAIYPYTIRWMFFENFTDDRLSPHVAGVAERAIYPFYLILKSLST